MANFSRIAGFDWDQGNERKSADKHGVSKDEAEQVFFNQPLVVEDKVHSIAEARYHALGVTDDQRRLHITFTLRDGSTKIRVISARDMHKKERRIYGQVPQEDS